MSENTHKHTRIVIERVSVTTIRRRQRAQRAYCNVCGQEVEVDLIADEAPLELTGEEVPANSTIDVAAKVLSSTDDEKQKLNQKRRTKK